MVELKEDTEKRILTAAEDVFVQNGLAGARMQEIADKAGINKSLLHYYYRSKEKLFGFAFRAAFKRIIPQIEGIINADIPLFDKIQLFTSKYIDVIIKHPFIPLFVISELNKHPEGLVDVIKSTGIKPDNFLKQVNEHIENGTIKNIKGEDLIVNMIGLCIFPIIARPLLQPIIFGDDKKKYEAFLAERKKHVPEFIINAIKK
jgi:TetR/AcrR family transcriptional regulator